MGDSRGNFMSNPDALEKNSSIVTAAGQGRRSTSMGPQMRQLAPFDPKEIVRPPINADVAAEPTNLTTDLGFTNVTQEASAEELYKKWASSSTNRMVSLSEQISSKAAELNLDTTKVTNFLNQVQLAVNTEDQGSGVPAMQSLMNLFNGKGFNLGDLFGGGGTTTNSSTDKPVVTRLLTQVGSLLDQKGEGNVWRRTFLSEAGATAIGDIYDTVQKSLAGYAANKLDRKIRLNKVKELLNIASSTLDEGPGLSVVDIASLITNIRTSLDPLVKGLDAPKGAKPKASDIITQSAATGAAAWAQWSDNKNLRNRLRSLQNGPLQELIQAGYRSISLADNIRNKVVLSILAPQVFDLAEYGALNIATIAHAAVVRFNSLVWQIKMSGISENDKMQLITDYDNNINGALAYSLTAGRGVGLQMLPRPK